MPTPTDTFNSPQPIPRILSAHRTETLMIPHPLSLSVSQRAMYPSGCGFGDTMPAFSSRISRATSCLILSFTSCSQGGGVQGNHTIRHRSQFIVAVPYEDTRLLRLLSWASRCAGIHTGYRDSTATSQSVLHHADSCHGPTTGTTSTTDRTLPCSSWPFH